MFTSPTMYPRFGLSKYRSASAGLPLGQLYKLTILSVSNGSLFVGGYRTIGRHPIRERRLRGSQSWATDRAVGGYSVTGDGAIGAVTFLDAGCRAGHGADLPTVGDYYRRTLGYRSASSFNRGGRRDWTPDCS